MRITHYLSQFRLAHGGVVRAALDISALLASTGHDISIITWDASDLPDEWKEGLAGRPVVHVVAPPTLPGGFFMRRALGEIDDLLAGSEVLHLHTPWDTANRQLAKIARRRDLPYVLTIHGMLDDWSMSQRGLKKRLYLALGGRALIENAAVAHCTAQGELDQAKKWFPRGRGYVAYCVLDLAPFRDLPGPQLAEEKIPASRTDEPVVLFLSRVHYKKRPEVLIDAAAILRDEGERFRVLIAGTGDDDYVQSLKDRVKERNLEDRVFFLGLVVGREKISLYEKAAMFVLPTSQENFGLVFPEALACRTPVIATKGTDIWPELQSSGGAIIAEGEPRTIAAAIRELLHNSARVMKMGHKGRAWVFRELDDAAIARQYTEMYEACVRHQKLH